MSSFSDAAGRDRASRPATPSGGRVADRHGHPVGGRVAVVMAVQRQPVATMVQRAQLVEQQQPAAGTKRDARPTRIHQAAARDRRAVARGSGRELDPAGHQPARALLPLANVPVDLFVTVLQVTSSILPDGPRGPCGSVAPGRPIGPIGATGAVSPIRAVGPIRPRRTRRARRANVCRDPPDLVPEDLGEPQRPVGPRRHPKGQSRGGRDRGLRDRSSRSPCAPTPTPSTPPQPPAPSNDATAS